MICGNEQKASMLLALGTTVGEGHPAHELSQVRVAAGKDGARIHAGIQASRSGKTQALRPETSQRATTPLASLESATRTPLSPQAKGMALQGESVREATRGGVRRREVSSQMQIIAAYSLTPPTGAALVVQLVTSSDRREQ